MTQRTLRAAASHDPAWISFPPWHGACPAGGRRNSGNGVVDEGSDVGAVCDVEATEGQSVADALGQLGQTIGAPRPCDDVMALFGKVLGDGFTDATAGTGDDDVAHVV